MATAVGILGYQGCIEPHEAMLDTLGVPHLRVRTPHDLTKVDRLILPGGESTTMLRFIDRFAMAEPLALFATSNAVWGICAGAILAARSVVNPEQRSLGLIDIKAHRNFYGSQLESFTAHPPVALLGGQSVEAHFIRAPLLSVLPATGSRPEVNIEASLEGNPIFLTQGRIWASSFHVELGPDRALHERFLRL